MKTKFSVGNRINHYKFGEGMIIQIRNNQMEVLFLDEQRRSFSTDTDEVVMIGIPVIENERKETPLPSASNKIKKELDQLKEGNRTEYFDYELNNQNKSIPMNKNTRVFHSLLGEGMITKILKNEYQIIFLNGDKHNIPISSPDLKLLTNSELNIDVTNTEIIDEIKNNQDDLFVGKQIHIPNVGDGMISKIFDETYEVIFLDGHKQSFILPDKTQNIGSNPKTLINDLKEVTAELQNYNNSTSHFDEKSLFVGKQINHPELGDGMVSKLGESFYEIIFLNGKKHRFEFSDKKNNNSVQDSFQFKSNSIEDKKELKPINNNIFQANEIYVGKQINHPESGEGMVSKIMKNSYEIIFLDGKKQSFSFSENSEEINRNEAFIEDTINKEVQKPAFDISSFELPIEKNQQKTNVILPKSSELETDSFFDKPLKTHVEKNRNKISTTSDISSEIDKHTSNEILIGTAVLHPKHGNGLICNLDEFEIEVVFYNHKKIVYSAKSNELKYLNVR